MRSPAVQFIVIVLAAMCAFTLPSAKSGAREAVQTLFVPVSSPARAVTRWATERVSPTHETDALSPDKTRSIDAVLRQNTALVTQIARLEAEVDQLKHVAADRAGLGADLQNYVKPAGVVAGSGTGRQTLTLNVSGLSDVRERQAVIQSGGFVGQIYAVAPGGATARVLLATDPESRLSARFVRVERSESGITTRRVELPTAPLVEGAGQNAMVVRLLPAADVRDVVVVGDIAVLDDPKTFPAALQGLRLGTVRRVLLPQTNAGHAVIELAPVADLGGLHDVLIVTR